MESRRKFLARCGAGAATLAALGAWPEGSVAGVPDPARLADLSAFAMEQARTAGASYADIRINRYRSQAVTFRTQVDRATGKPVEVPTVSDTVSFGFGLRVLADGAWGFSASSEVTRDAIARAAVEAVAIARANAPLRREPVKLAPTPSVQGRLPDPADHRPVHDPDRAEARPAPLGRDRGPQGLRRLLGHLVHRRPARRPVLRLDRGERDRAARHPDRPRVHRHGRRGRPQGQVADLPARLGLLRATRPSSGPASSTTPSGSPRRPSST